MSRHNDTETKTDVKTLYTIVDYPVSTELTVGIFISFYFSVDSELSFLSD